MDVGTQRIRRNFSLGGGIVALYAASATLPLVAIPGSHEPFEYLVDGVFATAVSLSVTFICFLKGWLYLPSPYSSKNCTTVMIPK